MLSCIKKPIQINAGAPPQTSDCWTPFSPPPLMWARVAGPACRVVRLRRPLPSTPLLLHSSKIARPHSRSVRYPRAACPHPQHHVGDADATRVFLVCQVSPTHKWELFSVRVTVSVTRILPLEVSILAGPHLRISLRQLRLLHLHLNVSLSSDLWSMRCRAPASVR